jgi:hypothetical protein
VGRSGNAADLFGNVQSVFKDWGPLKGWLIWRQVGPDPVVKPSRWDVNVGWGWNYGGRILARKRGKSELKPFLNGGEMDLSE